VRKLLRLKLESDKGVEVVGEGADGEEAVALVEELTPDVLLRGSANLQVILRIAVPPEGSPSTDHSRTSAASSHSSSSDSFSARSSSSRADSDASRS
jgi:hypothetical protein